MNDLSGNTKLLFGGFIDEMNSDMRVAAPIAAALGLRRACFRFSKVGGEITPLHKLTAFQAREQKQILADAGLGIRTVGTGILKAPVLGPTPEVPWQKHLDEVIKPSLEIGTELGGILFRIFAGYHAADRGFHDDINQIIDMLGQVIDLLGKGQAVAIENERGLGSDTGEHLAEILRRLNSAKAGVAWDGGNIQAVGYQNVEASKQFALVSRYLYVLHGKALHESDPMIKPGVVVEEKNLSRFVPIGKGSAGYSQVFQELPHIIRTIYTRMEAAGIEDSGLELDFEPHMDRSEQFYGETTPRNYKLAIQGGQELATKVGLKTDLWSMDDLQASWD